MVQNRKAIHHWIMNIVNRGEEFYLSVVYGQNDREQRKELWEHLENMKI